MYYHSNLLQLWGLLVSILIPLPQVLQTFLLCSKEVKRSNFTKTMVNWWLEIKTTIPPCIYYFGPFSSQKDAQISEYGFVEDLLQEKAHGITVEIKRLQPKKLTICDD